eukprot:Em0003g1384a
MALQQIAQINALLTEADRVGMRKSFGLREDYNPLLYIPADLYLCNAKDVTTPEEGNPGPGEGFQQEFRITYCDFFKPVLLNEWKSVAKLLIESNSNVRMYNVFENRLAPSRDIAKRLQHLRHICHGGNASERCGGALKELYFTPLLQHMVRGISMRELLGHKAIYQPGVARKMKYGILLTTFKLSDGSVIAWCKAKLPDGHAASGE